MNPNYVNLQSARVAQPPPPPQVYQNGGGYGHGGGVVQYMNPVPSPQGVAPPRNSRVPVAIIHGHRQPTPMNPPAVMNIAEMEIIPYQQEPLEIPPLNNNALMEYVPVQEELPPPMQMVCNHPPPVIVTHTGICPDLYHHALGQANLFSFENMNLRGELHGVKEELHGVKEELHGVKEELQGAYCHINRQNRQIKEQTERCFRNEQICAQKYQALSLEANQQIRSMQKRLEQQHQEVLFRNYEIENHKRAIDGLQSSEWISASTIQILRSRVTELTGIMKQQRKALKDMTLQRQLLATKLKSFKSFAGGVNVDFEAELQKLRAEFGTGAFPISLWEEENPSEEEGLGEDEPELRQMRNNLMDLSLLVFETLKENIKLHKQSAELAEEDEEEAETLEESTKLPDEKADGKMGTMMIHLKRANNSKKADWNVVKGKMGVLHSCNLCEKLFATLEMMKRHYQRRHKVRDHCFQNFRGLNGNRDNWGPIEAAAGAANNGSGNKDDQMPGFSRGFKKNFLRAEKNKKQWSVEMMETSVGIPDVEINLPGCSKNTY